MQWLCGPHGGVARWGCRGLGSAPIRPSLGWPHSLLCSCPHNKPLEQSRVQSQCRVYSLASTTPASGPGPSWLWYKDTKDMAIQATVFAVPVFSEDTSTSRPYCKELVPAVCCVPVNVGSGFPHIRGRAVLPPPCGLGHRPASCLHVALFVDSVPHRGCRTSELKGLWHHAVPW